MKIPITTAIGGVLIFAIATGSSDVIWFLKVYGILGWVWAILIAWVVVNKEEK